MIIVGKSSRLLLSQELKFFHQLTVNVLRRISFLILIGMGSTLTFVTLSAISF
jgi:hypothetical protein